MDEKARNRLGDAEETGGVGKCLNPESDEHFNIGVVGGVGPAVTVDFLDKIIRHTPADNDRDHLRMMVVHDPKIPGFSAHLVGDGPDPTAALSAVCKRLEEGHHATGCMFEYVAVHHPTARRGPGGCFAECFRLILISKPAKSVVVTSGPLPAFNYRDV